MEKSTWWIGLSSDWEVVKRTSWDEKRPDEIPNVHIWIKKTETQEFILSNSMKKIVIHEYSFWNNSFRRREKFPINKWDIIKVSTNKEWQEDKKVVISLKDPDNMIKNIYLESDNNESLANAFKKIDFQISTYDNWENYLTRNA